MFIKGVVYGFIFLIFVGLSILFNILHKRHIENKSETGEDERTVYSVFRIIFILIATWFFGISVNNFSGSRFSKFIDDSFKGTVYEQYGKMTYDCQKNSRDIFSGFNSIIPKRKYIVKNNDFNSV